VVSHQQNEQISQKNRPGKIISQGINFVIRKPWEWILKTRNVLKLWTKKLSKTFQKKFLTKWLFDVEIFMRMKKTYGKQGAIDSICNALKQMGSYDGSKLVC
jgi:hypothetical protein